MEIRWHGRGGQGVVTASELFAEAALLEGNYIQAFPEFGPERMGAPIKAFTRISESPITIHSQVYTPQIVVVLDPTLLGQVPVTEGLSDDGIVVVNSHKSVDEVKRILGFNGTVYSLDATKIAMDHIGRPVANTACAGALVKISELIKLDNLITVTQEKFREKLSEKAVIANVETIKAAYEEVSK
ncbi:MAG TPA: pyruvate synthase [Methanomicrobia archaeon]|nr:pyruvate synthase [Methanomicrobia archaeon]